MQSVLGVRALNRALLARQLLLERVRMPVLAVIEHLVGMQSQAPNPPYIGLWARLQDFRADELSQLMLDRKVVRIALLRSTIHLVSVRDALSIRPLVQPLITRSMMGGYGRHLAGVDFDALAQHARRHTQTAPATFDQIGSALRQHWPQLDAHTLGNAARTFVPLVQVPPRGVWGRSGQAAHTPIEDWTGQSLDATPSLEQLLRRFLKAFGPASVRDMSKWSGLTRLQETVNAMRGDLITFRDERGVELFDVPDAPRPDAETPAPVRLLPEWDNVLLSHADRSRIIRDEYLRSIMTPNGIVPGSVLVDGFVRGIWKSHREGRDTVLDIDLFEPITAGQREELLAEASSLLRFIAGAECKVLPIQHLTYARNTRPSRPVS